MNGKLQFVLIVVFVAMSFFAGYGFGRQDGDSSPKAEQGSSASQEESGHGHGGSDSIGGEENSGVVTKTVWSSENAQAGQDTMIRINIQDEAGIPVDEFDIEHEKLLHLIVVSKDMSYFNHIHPEYKGEGQFVITNNFPAGGEYKLIADYVPAGGSKTTGMEWITINGESVDPVPLTPDKTHSKIVDGVEVALNNDHPDAGKDYELNFILSDAKTKEPITDLEPYLGAVGHVVVLNETTDQYLHVHPIDEMAEGPEARFVTRFPDSGIYKIWAQFQRAGKVFTVPFVVEVK